MLNKYVKIDTFQSMFNEMHRDVKSHSIRVGIAITTMAKYAPAGMFSSYDLSREVLDSALMNGGSWHDIGKYMLSNALVKKPAGGCDTITKILQHHPIFTVELLHEYADVLFEHKMEKQIALDMGRYHHERFDGTGYPDGLAGYDIPFVAALCAVASAFDNYFIETKIKYRRPSFPAAVRLIAEDKALCSREVMKCFESARDDLRKIYENKKNIYISE